MPGAAAGRGTDKAARRKSKSDKRREALAALPAAPVEAAMNMLLARASFDLLRSAAFKQRVHSHIQRKLTQLHIPEFISSLEVCWPSPCLDFIHIFFF